jgi:hypothetical protein
VSWELGLRSGIVTASNAATVAENKPVYVIQLRIQQRRSNIRAHKNQDPVCILSVVFCIIIVLFLSNLGIHGMERP